MTSTVHSILEFFVAFSLERGSTAKSFFETLQWMRSVSRNREYDPVSDPTIIQKYLIKKFEFLGEIASLENIALTDENFTRVMEIIFAYCCSYTLDCDVEFFGVYNGWSIERTFFYGSKVSDIFKQVNQLFDGEFFGFKVHPDNVIEVLGVNGLE